MKKNTTIFFQIFTAVIGVGAFTFMLWEPHIEGRNKHATLFEIYFNDPFLLYAYTASIPFFFALFQIFKLLGNIKRNTTFSQEIIKTLRTVKYCAIITIGFVIPPEAYLFIVRPDDDIAGGVFMGILIIFGSVVTIAITTIYTLTFPKSTRQA